MANVTEILMERDNISQQQVEELMNDTLEEILNSDPLDSADILLNNLGLEEDYIMDLIDLF